jgi:predicted RNA binding protein YcfA (HicA-like mRNA interferase family)
MQKVADDVTTTVPVPNHDEIKRGTLRSIIRQSGLLKAEFETE